MTAPVIERARAAVRHALLPWRLARCGRRARVSRAARVFHAGRVALADDVTVGADAFLIGNSMRPQAIRLGAGVRIGDGCYLAATGGWIDVDAGASLGREVVAYGNGGLTIGAGAVLEDLVAISTINHLSGRTDLPIRCQGLELAPVIIGPRALVGAGAILLPGVRVGADARIAPGSVVTRDVPAQAHVAGVPARAVTANVLLEDRAAQVAA